MSSLLELEPMLKGAEPQNSYLGTKFQLGEYIWLNFELIYHRQSSPTLHEGSGKFGFRTKICMVVFNFVLKIGGCCRGELWAVGEGISSLVPIMVQKRLPRKVNIKLRGGAMCMCGESK